MTGRPSGYSHPASMVKPGVDQSNGVLLQTKWDKSLLEEVE
jgi:hypothetical protein